MKFACRSEITPVESIIVKHPRQAFVNRANVEANWQKLNYSACPDFDQAISEYEEFIEILKKSVANVYYLPEDKSCGLDSLYARDGVIITNAGAILCNMGKSERSGEPGAVGEYLKELGVPILGAISGTGKLEGGDLIWLDRKTLVVGQGYRTNDEGIRQLCELIGGLVEELIIIQLPHWRGEDDVFHLMSIISPIDHNLLAVYSPLLPVPFRQELLRRGIKLLEVPDSEFETMAGNILAVAPRKCIMLSGNPLMKNILEKNGVEVWEYDGDEISVKGAGGPTCLTRPLLRVE